MKKRIVKPHEFLAVRHSVLNGNTYDVERLVEDTLSLERHTKGRKVVPCFEGDLLQVQGTGEIVLTHQNFRPLTQKKYNYLKERKLAASLRKVLDKVLDYRQRSGGQRVVLCFEPKVITDRATIDATVRLLDEYEIGSDEAYFDSFFGGKLDLVEEANLKHGTSYARSLHLIGNISTEEMMMTEPKKGYDVLTIPHAVSFGDVRQPVIYGAVGSVELLEKIAENSDVYGAYVRLKEGSGVKGALVKLWNSVSNTEELRGKQIAEFGI